MRNVLALVTAVFAMLVLFTLPATATVRNDTAFAVDSSPPTVVTLTTLATADSTYNLWTATDICTTATGDFDTAPVTGLNAIDTGPPANGVKVNIGDTYNHWATINATNSMAIDGHGIYATARSGVRPAPALRAPCNGGNHTFYLSDVNANIGRHEPLHGGNRAYTV
ncbi:MAG: hypothetical protein WC773_03780 [Patescibacteria group bacterium]|jgi:hypothetical protein